MIEVSEAKELLLNNPVKLGGERVKLGQAFGRVLTEGLIAPYDHPLFDQSAVDGYALRFKDLGDPLECIDEAAAGKPALAAVTKGKCTRIFTGGMLPEGADTVVMQEYTEREGDEVSINDAGLKQGGNVRYKGEQIEKGSLALKSGQLIDAAAIGFLASIGIDYVLVSIKPNIGIIVTGSEFIEAGAGLEPGKIFGSNGPMLQTCLQRIGSQAKYERVRDDYLDLKEAFRKSMEENHITVITGGVSVGDHDLTRPVLEKLGCEVVFHKVAQKPGKPLLFARKGSKYIFGLPGNPRAVFVGFWEYVLPIINSLQGNAAISLKRIECQLAHDHNKRGERAEFLAGRIIQDKVEVLKGQNSHMLLSLIGADGLIYIPKEASGVKAGEKVEMHLLP